MTISESLDAQVTKLCQRLPCIITVVAQLDELIFTVDNVEKYKHLFPEILDGKKVVLEDPSTRMRELMEARARGEDIDSVD